MQQFTQDDCPPYQALSYSWGSSPKTTPIIVNGRVHHVRRNLFQFLEVKRGPNPRGIDALCINQEDIEERNRIVKKMKNIYERSQGVIIWLGAGDPEMEKTFVFLEDLKQKLQQLIETADDLGGPQNPFKPDTAASILPSDRIRHQKVFYDHPYWSRGWILQEASTPRRPSMSASQSSTVVHYGLHTLSMESFLFAFESLERDRVPLTSSYGLHVKTPYKRIASIRWFRDADDRFGPFPPIDLTALLTHARACEVTNPRDRLYALLAIATDGTDFTVDYSKSVADIYHEYAKTIILRDKTLDILGFSSEIQNSIFDFLALNGGTSTRYVTGGTRLEAFRHTLTADVNTMDATIGRDTHPFAADLNIEGNMLQISRGAVVPLAEHMDSKEMILTIIESVKGNKEMVEEVEKQLPCEGLIDGILKHRVLITTERGYIGVTADTAKPGDLVCIVRGAQFPLILRENDDGTTFKFVGDSYIHGIMDGEAVDEQYEQREGIFTVS
ncbi:heterokaryon incompatibility het-6 protein [Rutstroemia sp. NJR-2017a BVV2]|nr:heterokaryon incompatibility het-6 protein [Rutstroemia sp. NJR-2017a BVV2]PQE18559.1 heterokaryon incompatibility het-6 protein [Rutstroemia sp. NJR-2017a BVV2]